ncbi:MAG: hypothetical protein CSA58_02815 [Micrococcales bacterium]|nr:MAG: hypothetical protein CSA58_02815 [Micrococcales bacterium]
MCLDLDVKRLPTLGQVAQRGLDSGPEQRQRPGQLREERSGHRRPEHDDAQHEQQAGTACAGRAHLVAQYQRGQRDAAAEDQQHESHPATPRAACGAAIA